MSVYAVSSKGLFKKELTPFAGTGGGRLDCARGVLYGSRPLASARLAHRGRARAPLRFIKRARFAFIVASVAILAQAPAYCSNPRRPQPQPRPGVGPRRKLPSPFFAPSRRRAGVQHWSAGLRRQARGSPLLARCRLALAAVPAAFGRWRAVAEEAAAERPVRRLTADQARPHTARRTRLAASIAASVVWRPAVQPLFRKSPVGVAQRRRELGLRLGDGRHHAPWRDGLADGGVGGRRRRPQARRSRRRGRRAAVPRRGGRRGRRP